MWERICVSLKNAQKEGEGMFGLRTLVDACPFRDDVGVGHRTCKAFIQERVTNLSMDG